MVGNRPGDHLCWVHGGDDAWREAVAAFLDDGARGRDRLLYVRAGNETSLVDDLAGLPGRDAMLRTGQLGVLPLSQAGADGAAAGEATQLTVLAAEAEAAAAAGYRGLRIAAEASPFVSSDDGARRFIAYEALLDAVVDGAPLTMLCGYDGRTVDDCTARQLAFVHPLRPDRDPDVAGALYADGPSRWRLTGEVDMLAHTALDAALAGFPDAAEVHFDLRDLEFVDVGSTRSLVTLARRLAPAGRVVLHEPPPVLELILDAGWGDVPGLQVATS